MLKKRGTYHTRARKKRLSKKASNTCWHLLYLQISVQHRVQLTDEANLHVNALTSAELLSVCVNLSFKRTECNDTAETFFYSMCVSSHSNSLSSMWKLFLPAGLNNNYLPALSTIKCHAHEITLSWDAMVRGKLDSVSVS